MIKIAWDDRREAFDLLRNLKPLIGEQKTKQLWKAYSADTFQNRQHLLAYLHSLWEKLSGGLDVPADCVPPPDKNQLPHQGASIGTVIYLGKSYFPCILSKKNLSQHTLIVGGSGIGKTTLILNLLQRTHLPFLCFDYKQDYRHIVRSKAIKLIRWSHLRGNPLAPPENVSPMEWVQDFVDLFSGDTGLMYGSKGFLLDQIRILYARRGGIEHPRRFPTLHDMLRGLDDLKVPPTSRKGNYRDVVRGRLESLLYPLGAVFKERKPFPISDFTTTPTIIELDGLSKEWQELLISLILTAIFRSRMKAGHRDEANCLILLDEAKRVFDRHKEQRTAEGIPTISILASQVREYGMGLIVADQEPGKLARSIIANSATKILFRLGDHQDAEHIARSMGLHDPSLPQRLTIGQAVVKHPDIPEPFIIRLDQPTITKDVTETELMAKGAWVTPSASSCSPGGNIQAENAYPLEDFNNKTGMRLLYDIRDFPLATVSQRCERLGFSKRKMSEVREFLESGNAIASAQIIHPKGKFVWLSLTRIGAQLVDAELPEIRGGPVHRFWQWKLKERYESAAMQKALKNRPVKEEVLLSSNHRVDLLIGDPLFPPGCIGVEIETGTSDMIGNIQKCLDAGLQGVISATIDSTIASAVKEQVAHLPKSDQERVRVLVCQLYSSPKSIDPAT